LPRGIPKPPVQIGELPDTADGKSLTERLLETETRLTRRSDEVATENVRSVTGTAERVATGSAPDPSRETDLANTGVKDAGGTMRVAALPPVPRRKPARLSTPLPSAVVQPVKSTPVAPQKRTLPVLGRGRFVVQIASHRRQADALAEFAGLKRRYPQVIGNYKPSIQRADLGDRGIYYRLRIGPLASKADAARFCESLKTAGKNDCLIRRR
jgi:cell division protein FtsN